MKDVFSVLDYLEFKYTCQACNMLACDAVPIKRNERKRRDYATGLLVDVLRTRRGHTAITLAKAKGHRLAYVARVNFGTGHYWDTADSVHLSAEVVGETEKSFTLASGGHVAKNKVLTIVRD